MSENSSFSRELPGLQIAWDATSLSALKRCPRAYQLSIIEGWGPRAKSIHLVWGGWLHSALEEFTHQRAARGHDDALASAIGLALTISWDYELDRPYASRDALKHRESLLRVLIDYADHYKADELKTLALPNGAPAVEVSFALPLTDEHSVTGEDYMLCGHIDRLVVTKSGEVLVTDRKTTGKPLDEHFFRSFTPSNQFTTYAFAASALFNASPRGVIIDAIRVTQRESEFARRGLTIVPDALREWRRELTSWLRTAERYALHALWPKNESACYGCDFRRVCAAAPSLRPSILASDFVRRIWDPLIPRNSPLSKPFSNQEKQS